MQKKQQNYKGNRLLYLQQAVQLIVLSNKSVGLSTVKFSPDDSILASICSSIIFMWNLTCTKVIASLGDNKNNEDTCIELLEFDDNLEIYDIEFVATSRVTSMQSSSATSTSDSNHSNSSEINTQQQSSEHKDQEGQQGVHHYLTLIVAFENTRLIFYDVLHRTQTANIDSGHREHNIRTFSLSVAPDNVWLATGSPDERVNIWQLTEDLRSCELLETIEVGFIINAVKLTSNYLAVATVEGLKVNNKLRSILIERILFII